MFQIAVNLSLMHSQFLFSNAILYHFCHFSMQKMHIFAVFPRQNTPFSATFPRINNLKKTTQSHLSGILRLSGLLQISGCGAIYYRSVELSCVGVASADAKPQVQYLLSWHTTIKVGLKSHPTIETNCHSESFFEVPDSEIHTSGTSENSPNGNL